MARVGIELCGCTLQQQSFDLNAFTNPLHFEKFKRKARTSRGETSWCVGDVVSRFHTNISLAGKFCRCANIRKRWMVD